MLVIVIGRSGSQSIAISNPYMGPTSAMPTAFKTGRRNTSPMEGIGEAPIAVKDDTMDIVIIC